MRFFTTLAYAVAGFTMVTAVERDSSATPAANPSGWDYGSTSLARKQKATVTSSDYGSTHAVRRNEDKSADWDYGAVTSSNSIVRAARRTASAAWDYGSNTSEDSSAKRH
ncbi:hypothetical protein PFICI_13229 [Pestalotiopsis fici W106-1]|uniref:Uncharacterized protein n=1 Tax=Pestalotiopsis fici (strain W106-1 / CGMCC3.15140) TaxID=1229662 RepID=W3WLH9_PESFW|nr:uncharacterized protein PFICI_13229 [Pestalotiopsis fici W106-1]ETS74745.1 hypothetical protein PFICI_13229 [Pestalotiopsis fici W106-1]